MYLLITCQIYNKNRKALSMGRIQVIRVKKVLKIKEHECLVPSRQKMPNAREWLPSEISIKLQSHGDLAGSIYLKERIQVLGVGRDKQHIIFHKKEIFI